MNQLSQVKSSSFSVSVNNFIQIDEDNVDVEIAPAEVNQRPSSLVPGSSLLQKSIVINSPGKCNVTYTIPRGNNIQAVNIHIRINGLSINNSPFHVLVKTERLSESWKRIAIYGEEGSEPGKFCRPWGVALSRLPLKTDPKHKLIGDHMTHTIPIHSKPFYNWNCPSPNKNDYLLAVADRSNNRIQLLKLRVSSGQNVPNENIFNNGFMFNNSPEISVLHVFGGGPGTRPGQFDRPAGIAINVNIGQLVVADKDNHRVQVLFFMFTRYFDADFFLQVFDLAGNFQFKFGEKGSRAGQFCYPWDIAICPLTSLILVSDTRNRRIQLFTHLGQYLWHCGQPLDSPRGVAFLTPDRYIVSDFNKHRLLIVDRNDNRMSNGNAFNREDSVNSKYIGYGEGSAWGEFLRPQGLVASFANNQTSGKPLQVLCADSRNNRIAIWNSCNQHFEYINDDTSKGDSVGSSFDRPSGIAVADNLMAVVDFGNNRLQLFQKTLV